MSKQKNKREIFQSNDTRRRRGLMIKRPWNKTEKFIFLFIVVAVILAIIQYAYGQTITWKASTGWTGADNSAVTGTFTPEEMGTMRFYLRARKQGDINGRKYFGQTDNGATVWTGDMATEFIRWNLAAPVPGEIWEVTVSQAFQNPGGKELDSPETAPYFYTFPFGQDRSPDAPSETVVKEEGG